MSDLAQALMVAIRVHADQRDKQGEPYLLHVLRVAEAVFDEAKIVAVLHDVIEDDDHFHSLPMLDDDERGAVLLLTRTEPETYARYIENIAEAMGREGRLAREVKLADLRDNLGRMPAKQEKWGGAWRSMRPEEWASLRRRYEKAIETLESPCPPPHGGRGS